MMPSLSEIRQIRADMNKIVMPDTGYILSKTEVNNSGQVVETWSASGTVMCRLDLFTSRGVGLVGEEMLRAAALNSYTTWILTAPYGTAITTDNRFELGDNIFNVVEVDAGRSWGVNLRATLEKV